MTGNLKAWLERVLLRRLPQPPANGHTSISEAQAAKAQAEQDLAAAERRGERVERVVEDLHRERTRNGFTDRLEYAYGLKGKGRWRHA